MKYFLYSLEDFIKDVRAELVSLKKLVTKREVSRLQEYLAADIRTGCIYGQLTGDCFSRRASFLIWKCCKQYLRVDSEKQEALWLNSHIDEVLCFLVDPPKSSKEFTEIRTRLGKESCDGICYYSAMEAYLFLRDAQKNNILRFLKNETVTLEL